MENVVTMSLADYDALKTHSVELEQKIKALRTEVSNLEVFVCKVKYDGGLSLNQGKDYQHFLDKAFEQYKETHVIEQREDIVWSFADKKKPVEIIAE